MKKTVIAIGLDAAEPTLVETWLEQGLLKNLASLKQNGAYGRLKNFSSYRAETPWTTFLTGCSPNTTGYWGPVKLRDGTYDVNSTKAYDYKEYPPFYALGEDYKVAIFDMPQAPLSQDVNGLQVLGWGAHSPQTPSHSLPEDALTEITERHGRHAAFGHDHANIYHQSHIERLKNQLLEGIQTRSSIIQDLLESQDWDFLLTMFGETHSGGHCLWHLNDPNHPAHRRQGPEGTNYLLEVYQAADQAIGEIMEAAPEDASIVIFSAHGMQANNLDLTSTFFLAELMYRWSLPGKVGFSSQPMNQPPEKLSPWRLNQRAYRDLWAQKSDPNPLTRWMRSVTPTKAHRIYASLLEKFGLHRQGDFVSPYQLQNEGGAFDWQPASWYAPAWHKMKAFALPSFSEGYVRINLKGREPNGLVDVEEYDAVCDEIITQLRALRNTKTGNSIVREVIRTRTKETLTATGLPDADLIVMWNESELSDCVESDTHGRMGPAPFQRSGSHSDRGFLFIQSPQVKPGSDLSDGHALDLAPTLLALMDAPQPEHLEGRSLLPQKLPIAVSV